MYSISLTPSIMCACMCHKMYHVCIGALMHSNLSLVGQTLIGKGMSSEFFQVFVSEFFQVFVSPVEVHHRLK